MADVCAIFHWQPSAFDSLSLEELMSWRHLAIERAEILGLAKRT